MKWPNLAWRSNRTFALMCLASRLRTSRFSRWIKDKDWQQFKSDGYMVIQDVIPTCLTTKAVLDIAAFVGADIRDSTTWYRGPVENDGMVALHHAQSLWNIRQYPTLHQVFSEYHGTHKLMVDINRCCFRPPCHRDWPTLSPRPDSLGHRSQDRRRGLASKHRFAQRCCWARCRWISVFARRLSELGNLGC
jgi:hypothetical protein